MQRKNENVIISKGEKSIMNISRVPFYLGKRGLLKWLPDSMYLRFVFKGMVGYKLNLKQPHTFNEKIQWLKLYDRKPEYVKMVDKYEVKKMVAKLIGEEHIIPTIGVWNSFDEINFESLPNQFVLKCTHDSGGIVICKDKSKLDVDKARKKIEKCLKKNYYWIGREWAYKNVQPRIIAEPYMVDESGYELKDYKFFCFNGIVKMMFVASDRQDSKKETKFDFYDMDFKHLDVRNGHPNATKLISKPTSFENMKHYAEILSANIPLVRIDFYDINGQVYFGEITLAHNSGFYPFEPIEWDYTFGDMIKLPIDYKG